MSVQAAADLGATIGQRGAKQNSGSVAATLKRRLIGGGIAESIRERTAIDDRAPVGEGVAE